MRVLITGGKGMLGGHLVAEWQARRPEDDLVVLTRDDLDLTDRRETRERIEEIAPETIIHAAAKVGGIAAKIARPADYLLHNLLIDSSVLSAAIELRVPEVLYVGSAAAYPAAYTRPFVEEDLLGGPLESANEGYALSKIAAIKLCEYASFQYGLDFRVAMPSNLYGPGDHYGLAEAHLVAATLVKVHAAKQAGAASVSVWGDGTARREFTYAGDLAAWLVEQTGSLSAWPARVNVGCGVDHSVALYYETAKKVVGFEGALEFDSSKPAGVPRRLIDSTVARRFGWNPVTSLEDGMAATYADYLGHSAQQER